MIQKGPTLMVLGLIKGINILTMKVPLRSEGSESHTRLPGCEHGLGKVASITSVFENQWQINFKANKGQWETDILLLNGSCTNLLDLSSNTEAAA